jgi:opacity protein-like surface antigen
MRRYAILLGLLTVATVSAAPDAWAFRDHTRTGWLVGIGYGGGAGQYTTGAGESIDTERGAAPQIRLGRTVARHWMLGANYEGWFHELGDVNEKQRYSLQNLALAATCYPGNPGDATGGLFLRGGAGLAWGRYAVVPLEEVDGVLTQMHGENTDETGLGFVLGVGYEFRVVEHCAVGLGASVNYVTIGKDIFDHGLYAPLAINVNWYF